MFFLSTKAKIESLQDNFDVCLSACLSVCIFVPKSRERIKKSLQHAELIETLLVVRISYTSGPLYLALRAEDQKPLYDLVEKLNNIQKEIRITKKKQDSTSITKCILYFLYKPGT